MSKTILEISTSVLQKLGRLPDGQVAPQSQVTIVEEAYDGLYQELLNDSLVDWAASDDIPDYAVFNIKILLLGMVASDFGVPNVWLDLSDTAKERLSGQIASPYVPETTQFENV